MGPEKYDQFMAHMATKKKLMCSKRVMIKFSFENIINFMGTFLGFYTGDFTIAYRDSLYAVKLNHVHIYPFYFL